MLAASGVSSGRKRKCGAIDGGDASSLSSDRKRESGAIDGVEPGGCASSVSWDRKREFAAIDGGEPIVFATRLFLSCTVWSAHIHLSCTVLLGASHPACPYVDREPATLIWRLVVDHVASSLAPSVVSLTTIDEGAYLHYTSLAYAIIPLIVVRDWKFTSCMPRWFHAACMHRPCFLPHPC